MSFAMNNQRDGKKLRIQNTRRKVERERSGAYYSGFMTKTWLMIRYGTPPGLYHRSNNDESEEKWVLPPS